MSSVRVNCPECNYHFAVAESRVGGLVKCRDCGAEFRVEFAEENEQDDRGEQPAAAARPRTRSRVDVDQEPEEWKSDLPIRSPMPLLLVLAGLQVLVAGFLLINFFIPVAAASPTQGGSYYRDPGATTTKKATTPSTQKW